MVKGFKELSNLWDRKSKDEQNRMIKELYNGEGIPNGGVDGSKLALESVDTPFIKKEAVTTEKLAADSVNNEKVINGSLGISKINPRELMEETIVRSDKSRNLFNKHVVTFGYYIANWDGKKIANKDMACIMIPIEPLKKLKLSGTTQQIAFFKQDGTYISGKESVAPSDIIEPPQECTIIGINCKIDELDRVQLEYGDKATAYVPFGGDMVKTLVSNYSVDAKTVITVSKDGSKDFKRLRDAIDAANDASSIRPYEIKIYDGVYNLEDEYSILEINQSNFLGYMKNDSVTWTGIGNVIISANLDITKHNDVTTKRVSTVNFVGNGDVYNIVVIGINVRYAIHDDLVSGPLIQLNLNSNRLYESVKATKLLGNKKGYAAAVGGGLWSGMKVHWKNSTFFSEWDDICFSYHNNKNFKEKATLVLEGNDFKSNHKHWSIRFGEAGSGTPDEIILINNNIQSGIWMFPETAYASKINFKISGSGNSNVPIRIDLPSGSNQQVVYNIVNDTERVNNISNEVIKKGDLVYRINPGAVSKMDVGTPKILYAGIAFEDIPVNEYGFIKIGGYIDIKFLNLTGLKHGDLIGIKDGKVSIVESNDFYFGYVLSDCFIKLL